MTRLRSRLTHLLSGSILVLGSAQCWSATLSFDAAWEQAKQRSDRVAASQAGINAQAEQLKGLVNLGGPTLTLSVAAYQYSQFLGLDLDPANQQRAQLGQDLMPPLQGLAGTQLRPVSLPNRYTYNQADSDHSVSLTGIWPLYTGGRASAVRSLVLARQHEAMADASEVEQALGTQLVQRYFGAQLAQRTARLQDEAFAQIERIARASERETGGSAAARVERLRVRAALEDARRLSLRTRAEAEAAQAQLARSLKLEAPVQAGTPLFVISQPLPALGSYIDSAMLLHPGLSKLQARKSQARFLLDGEEALSRPQVFAFGQRDFGGRDGSWVAGVAMRWTIFDALDHQALGNAGMQQILQADRLGAQARGDVAMEVEKHWRTANTMREQFLSMQASEGLAQEMRQLREEGLKDGSSGALELIGAELELAQARGARAQAAYDYVLALAQLLQACGLSERLPDYIAQADIHID